MSQEVDFSIVADLLTKDIQPEVVPQMYNKAPMWATFGGWQPSKADKMVFEASRVNTQSVSFQNNTIYTTILTGRMAAGGINTSELVTYGAPGLQQGALSITTQTNAFLIPKQVMNIKAAGTIANTLQFSISESTNSLAMDLNRQCYGDGTATLAYCSGSGGPTTSIDLKPKATASTLYNGDIDLARYFPVGTYIKIGANAVTKVTGATGLNTITVADTQTVVNNTAILKYTASSTLASEMPGLAAIVGTGDYQSIAVATNPRWQAAKVDTNSGTARTMANTIATLQKNFVACTTTGKPTVLTMNVSNFQAYGATLTNEVRFSKKDMLADGWVGLDYMGGNATIILDPDCPDDRVYTLSPEFLYHAEYQPFQFETGTMGSGMRVTQSLDYEVIGDWMGNIGSNKRSAHAVATNIVG